MEQEILRDLVDQYITGEISDQDKARLAAMMDNPEVRHQLESLMKESFERNDFEGIENVQMKSAIKNWLQGKLTEKHKRAEVFTIGKWAAAASIVGALVFGTYFQLTKENKDVVAKTVAPSTTFSEIKAPDAVRATITLANGRQIFLDNVPDGSLANEGNVQLEKLPDGKIVYSGYSEEILFNVLNNPKGSKVIDMVLSDGTKVTLDAGSSIRYPVAFAAKERSVEMTGQVWFDVVHNEKTPFKVTARGIEINDLGTQFNVNAFEDESVVRTTLMEGAVSISAMGRNITIKPGQQSMVSAEGSRVVEANLSDVLAWKNGFYSFRHSDIKEIMRQLARWYDLEIRYEGEIKDQEFTGKIDRTLSLSEVLKILEQTGVHFRIEGARKLVILP